MARCLFSLGVVLLLGLLLGGDLAHAARLQDIRARGELLCGVKDSVAPFGFLDEMNNRLVGFEVDLCKAVADKIGVRFTPVAVTSADRIPMLLQGAVDIVAATMTHNYEREELIDFSITYFMDSQRILASAKSGIKSVRDLAGKKVGTAKGSTSEKNLKAQQPQCTVLSFESYPQAFLALKRGEVDAVSTDYVILVALKSADENPGEWVISDEPLSKEPYAMGVPENESDFRDLVNMTLAELWTSGSYAKIYNRWFGPESKYPLPLQWEMTVWP